MKQYATMFRIQGPTEKVAAAVTFFQCTTNCELESTRIDSPENNHFVIYELATEEICSSNDFTGLAQKFPQLKMVGWLDRRSCIPKGANNQFIQFESGRGSRKIAKRILPFVPNEPERCFPSPVWWTETEAYHYKTTRGNTIRIEQYLDCESKVSIPHLINGLPVSEIGHGAFASNTQLQKIILPPTVRRISKRAFAGCTALKEITGLEHVTRIEAGAFKSTKLAKDPTFSIAIIENQSLQCLFSGMKHYVVPPEIRAIEASAFRECPVLRKITLPDTLTYIDSDAFARCDSLKEIVLTNHAIPVDWSALKGTSVRTITLPDNPQINIRNPFEFDCIRIINHKVQLDRLMYEDLVGRFDSAAATAESSDLHRLTLLEPAKLCIKVEFENAKQYAYNCPFKVKIGDLVMVDGSQRQASGRVIEVLKNDFDNRAYMKQVVKAYRLVK